MQVQALKMSLEREKADMAAERAEREYRLDNFMEQDWGSRERPSPLPNSKRASTAAGITKTKGGKIIDMGLKESLLAMCKNPDEKVTRMKDLSKAERRDVEVQFLMKKRTKMALAIERCQGNERLLEQQKKITELNHAAHLSVQRVTKAEDTLEFANHKIKEQESMIKNLNQRFETNNVS